MNQPLRSAADFQYQELIHIWKWLSSVVLYSNCERRGNPPHSSQHATYMHRAIFHVDHNQVVVGSLTVSYNHLPQVIKWSWKIQYFVLKHEALPILSSVEKKPLFFRPLEEAGIEPRQNHPIWFDGQTYSALPTIHSAATGEWLMTHQWLHHSDPLLACLNLCTRGSWPWNACWRFRLQLLLIYPNLTRQAKQPVDEMQFKQMTCMLNRKCWLLEKVCGQVYMSIHTETYRLFWNTVRLKKLHWNFLMKGSERQFSPLSTPVHCAFSK